MSKTLDIGVEKDHIESLTKANGINSLSELLWNSLDADASEIIVEYKKNVFENYDSISITDNGHGLTYEKAQDVFSRLGGSEKKSKTHSPLGRQYHGKEGKGRYKGLALGDLVKFTSTYPINGNLAEFTITIDKNQISKTEFSDLINLKSDKKEKGFKVEIFNINQKNVDNALKIENRSELEEKFASYWISYPQFKIYINGSELDFKSLIKNSVQIVIPFEIGDEKHEFTFKVIEWNFVNNKKTYLCNSKGIPFIETTLYLRANINISLFIQSDYVEELQRTNTLEFYESNEYLIEIVKKAKEYAKEYVRKRLHEQSVDFIQNLKKSGIYPYKEPSENIVEESKRQVFDIVALQVHEYLPTFNKQDDKNKKLTLKLISEALENDSNSLRRILNELIELPQEQREDLANLLEDTTLSNVIDAMKEVKNRLNFLNGLEQIIYDSDFNKHFLERKHLHKIIKNETWIFGDEYSYGVDDVTLKNVLKSYLKDCLHRDDFEEIVNSEDNGHLETIPDVCLWQQYSLGTAGKENLVIELKRPSLNAGLVEMGQVMGYASKVANDKRFPKDKTRWKFILVTKDFKEDLIPQLNQKNRKFGHVSEGDNFDVYILSWGNIISEAKYRHEFIKEKLNLNLQDNEEGLNYLKSKYKQYLPSEI